LRRERGYPDARLTSRFGSEPAVLPTPPLRSRSPVISRAGDSQERGVHLKVAVVLDEP